jgi:hypothetical protein
MQFDRLGRREFITLLGGAAAFPLAARAQPPDRVRRIGFLMNLGADDPQGQARLNAFRQRLAELSWTEATCKSIFAGALGMLINIVDTRSNWWSSHRAS